MKLVSFGPPGAERPGVMRDDRIVDLLAADSSLPPSVRGILAAGLLDRVATVASGASGAYTVAAGEVRLGPPVADPSKIICVGRNYHAHAAEQNEEAPSFPMLFSKGPNVLCGHGDAVPYPRGVEELDYEVELAFVVGTRARQVPLKRAGDYVAGFAPFIDLTARDVQRREKQWFRGKSFDGAGPFGPFLVSADEVADPQRLAIALEVNGEVRQSASTAEMTFTVAYLLHHISQTITLEPGDVVATGTPPGVGAFRDPPVFLRPGDRLRATIETLGRLECTIGSAETVS